MRTLDSLLSPLLALALPGTTLAAQPQVAAFPSVNAAEMRVATIGHRLAVRGAARCSRLAPATGLILHDLAAYDPAERPGIEAQFALGSGVGVRGVVPRSAADRAGLAPGDVILALQGRALSTLPLPPAGRTASYDRVEAFLDALDVATARGGAELRVRRDGEDRTLVLPLERGCAARVALAEGSRPGAWSDERYGAVTLGLVEQAGDDELAFALAHEMAHVVLGHGAGKQGSFGGLGPGGKRARDRERAADRLGLAVMLDAGYAAAGAEALLQRLSRAAGPSFSLTHPPTRARIDALRQAQAELQAGLAE